MANRLITWAKNQRTGDPLAKALLLLLADIANADGTCFPSHATLSEDSEIPRRTMQRKLDRLAASGFLVIEAAHRENGARTSNTYRLSADPEYLRPSGRTARDDPHVTVTQGYAPKLGAAPCAKGGAGYEPLEGTLVPPSPQQRQLKGPEGALQDEQAAYGSAAEFYRDLAAEPQFGADGARSVLFEAEHNPPGTLTVRSSWARDRLIRDAKHLVHQWGVVVEVRR